MSVATETAPVTAATVVAGSARRLTVPACAIAVETAAFAVLLATSGSPGWRVVRLAVVLSVGATGLLAERRARLVARGVGGCVGGVVGLSAGAGIGVMHVVKSDIDLAAIAGLVVLASGLIVLSVGTGRLWRATPRWWRLGALPLAFVVVEFAVIPLTVAIYATNLPATGLGGITPAAEGVAYQDVAFITGDHVRLAGWYIPSRNGAAVALLHGSGSTRAAVLPQAAVLARHGYGVLLFDARGHGRSGGVGMDFGWWGDRDLAAAVTWLGARPDVTGGRIAAVGMSMGGEEAIGAAAADPRIRAVVTEGALWRGSQDTAWLPTNPDGLAQRAMLAIQTQVTGLLTDAPQPISLHRAIGQMAPRPLLLIAGKPELRGDRYLHDAAPGSTELWELPDTPHSSALAYHPAEWEARVIGFLDRALTATP